MAFIQAISLKCFKKTLIIFLVITTVAYIFVTVAIFPSFPVRKFAKRISLLFRDSKQANSTKDSDFHANELTELEIPPKDDIILKSPYFLVHKNHTKNGTTESTRKVKVISCFNCPEWFIKLSFNRFNRDFNDCPFSQCVLHPRANMDSDDVVLFFVGHLGNAKVPRRRPGQVWVKCYYESPVHYEYPNPYEPWKDVFNWTMNYRPDSDIFSPASLLYWRQEHPLSDDEYMSIAKNKTKTAAWFVSNCVTQGRRELYVKEMKKYIDIDIYGKCGSLSCNRFDMDACERKLTTTYKFYLGFENSFCKDYVTEKFFRVFTYRSHVIPVVRGAFDYNKYFPNGTFINSADFSSPRDLALYLKQLGDDYVSYARMLKEKDRFAALNFTIDWCQICEKVHTDTGTKMIPDIRKWSHNGACYRPSDYTK